MTLRLIEAPGDLPLSLAEAKLHLRISENDTTEDALITSLIAAATLHVEQLTGRRLVSQTWSKSLDAFPKCGGAIELLLPPVKSISVITFIDVDGSELAIDESAYELDAQSETAWVIPAYGYIWPVARAKANAVVVEFISGYGGADDVPESIKAALKLLIAHLYENREAVIVDARVQAFELPVGIAALLSPFRVMRFV